MEPETAAYFRIDGKTRLEIYVNAGDTHVVIGEQRKEGDEWRNGQTITIPIDLLDDVTSSMRALATR